MGWPVHSQTGHPSSHMRPLHRGQCRSPTASGVNAPAWSWSAATTGSRIVAAALSRMVRCFAIADAEAIPSRGGWMPLWGNGSSTRPMSSG